VPLTELNPLLSLNPLTAVSDAGNAAASAAASAALSAVTPAWLTGNAAKYTVILLGMLFVAAGLFSFDKSREVILETAKQGAKGAAAVAA
jgi:hypothetical protein